MALITIREIIDMVIMTVILGYIFMDYIKRPKTEYDVIGYKSGFDFEDFKLAMLITAPGIIFHELSHKFVALAFGLIATFHASFFGLSLGLLLKLFHSPFIIFAPGFVEINGPASNIISAVISFAGPFINLVLFVTGWCILNYKKKLTKKEAMIWYMTKQINLFLFIFNMLPIPPLDGSKVFFNLINAIF